MSTSSPSPGQTPPSAWTDAEGIPCHDAVTLTGGGPVAAIYLHDQRYALRITRQGKLILTK